MGQVGRSRVSARRSRNGLETAAGTVRRGVPHSFSLHSHTRSSKMTSTARRVLDVGGIDSPHVQPHPASAQHRRIGQYVAG